MGMKDVVDRVFTLRGGNQSIVDVITPYRLDVAQINLLLFDGTTITNMSADPQELTNVAGICRPPVNLLGRHEARFTGYVTVAGATGAFLYLEYATAVEGSYDALGTSAVSYTIGATGHKDSGWVTLAPGAITDWTFLKLMGDDGDGAADPLIRQIRVHFR